MAPMIVRIGRVLLGLVLSSFFFFKNGSGPVSHVLLKNCERYPFRQERMFRECVVVVGASSGIGYELTKELTENYQARVILTAPTQDRADALGKLINPNYLLASLPLDLGDKEQVSRFASAVKRIAKDVCPEGRLNRLFLNAGMIYGLDYKGPWEQSPREKPSLNRDYSYAVNFVGHADLLRELTDLIQRSDTIVVATTSTASYKGNPMDSFQTNLRDETGKGVLKDNIKYYPLNYDQDAYSRLAAGKLALNALIFSLQEKGIRAALINPGYVATRFGRTDRSFETGNKTNHGWPIAVSAEGAAHHVIGASFVNSQLSKYRVLSSFYLPAYVYPSYMEWLQRYTTDSNHLWGCPVPIGNTVEFTERLKNAYFNDL